MIYLKHVEGSKRGQVEEFDLERIRIGRHPDNDLTFDPAVDREVSGHHAEILCQGEQVSIRDLQSRNGTLVNGRRINQTTMLQHADVIQFAPTGPKVIFSLGEAAHGTGTMVIDRDQIAPAPSASAEPAASPVPKPTATRRRKTYVVVGALVVAVLVLVLLGVAAWRSWTLFLCCSGWSFSSSSQARRLVVDAEAFVLERARRRASRRASGRRFGPATGAGMRSGIAGEVEPGPPDCAAPSSRATVTARSVRPVDRRARRAGLGEERAHSRGQSSRVGLDGPAGGVGDPNLRLVVLRPRRGLDTPGRYTFPSTRGPTGANGRNSSRC